MIKRFSKTDLSGLYPIIDTEYVALDKAAQVGETRLNAASGRVRILQLRSKKSPAREIIKAARQLRDITLNAGALFIVNDRVDVALMSEADGVHLGQDDIPVKEARKLLTAGKIIGLSTHNTEEALEAVRLGADYISFGPVFKTLTKKDARVPGGTQGLKKVSDALKDRSLPIVAIGGITRANVAEVMASGASMTALIHTILRAEDTAQTIKELLIEVGPPPPRSAG